jgi:hypothetical protein
MDVEEFKSELNSKTAREIVEQRLLCSSAEKATTEYVETVRHRICTSFSIPSVSVEIVVVGSAKLGFSLVEKEVKGEIKPRYRPFDEDSDIDVAVVSPLLFERVWSQLAVYGHKQVPFPWKSKLNHYLLFGWLRPDLFPSDSRPAICKAWWRVFDGLSSDRSLGFRKTRGGLYYSKEFLANYQMRAVVECQIWETSHENDSNK